MRVCPGATAINLPMIQPQWSEAENQQKQQVKTVAKNSQENIHLVCEVYRRKK